MEPTIKDLCCGHKTTASMNEKHTPQSTDQAVTKKQLESNQKTFSNEH